MRSEERQIWNSDREKDKGEERAKAEKKELQTNSEGESTDLQRRSNNVNMKNAKLEYMNSRRNDPPSPLYPSNLCLWREARSDPRLDLHDANQYSQLSAVSIPLSWGVHGSLIHQFRGIIAADRWWSWEWSQTRTTAACAAWCRINLRYLLHTFSLRLTCAESKWI